MRAPRRRCVRARLPRLPAPRRPADRLRENAHSPVARIRHPGRKDFMTPITGSIVALATPMHDDGSVDYQALAKLIDWHVEQGTDCIGVVGTTGESPTVDVAEHHEIIRFSVEHARGR